jgi:hypothetical protein
MHTGLCQISIGPLAFYSTDVLEYLDVTPLFCTTVIDMASIITTDISTDASVQEIHHVVISPLHSILEDSSNTLHTSGARQTYRTYPPAVQLYSL